MFVDQVSFNKTLLELDRTEDPTDVAFSDDGLTVFTTNYSAK